MNVIIDGTLGSGKQARILLDRLQTAVYDVLVADVETTQKVRETRTLGRWESGYLAENGMATSTDTALGGRWVPQSFPASLFNGPNDIESVCAVRCVSDYQVDRVADKDRAKPGGPLVDHETLEAVRATTTTWTTHRRSSQQGNKGFGR